MSNDMDVCHLQKNMDKNLCMDKKSATNALQTASRRGSKKVEATGDLVGNKSSENIRLLQKNIHKD